MPRKARLDAPGVLQHVIARGIERRPIFSCDEDYEFLLKRLGHLLEETDIECFAWVLIPNHFHLLLRTGSVWAVLRGKIAEQWGLSPEDLLSGSKERSVVRVRSVLSYLAVRKMGIRATQVAEWLKVSQPAVSKSLLRGPRLVKENPVFMEVFQ